ncbi:DUF4292 domain-containing protein [Niastella caeni]|uniref:DUF4292 domain-containing protein n=1 Tax=Niastella caeni TaxID=2569763 RepID=A0A4V4H1P3_9BACT|nr:DUF4292 domain-containing protein [Niastella caeni]THU41316.1 DUF4292 domain-containing protein [Niastella caeni]
MKYIAGICLLALVMAAATSCRSTKTIQTAIAKKDTAHVVPVVDHRADSMLYIKKVWDTIRKNNIDFQTFSAKIKVDFEGGDGKKNDFNAFVRIKKDSVLWININAALGFDAFRVLVTPDSVKVINKLNKTVQLRSVESLQEVTRMPMTFADLQNLLIGNPIFLDSNINSYKKDERTISLISLGILFKHLLTVNKDDYTLQYSKLDDVDVIRARTAYLTYGEYQYKNGIRFSTYRKITVSEKSKLDIEMQFKQFDFNADLSFPFTIPKNYRRQ